jgi:flavodoxin I
MPPKRRTKTETHQREQKNRSTHDRLFLIIISNHTIDEHIIMKLLLALTLPTVISGFAFSAANTGRAFNTALDAGPIIYYSTSTGNTETVATYLKDAVGCDMEDIGDASAKEVASYDCLIVGAPTWHTDADEQRSGTAWDDFLYDTLPSIDLEGKKVAVFGMGDQQGYGDNYCDAAGELYDLFSAKGCKMFGLTSTDGYDHMSSKAEIDGKFVGLMFDEDNQYDLSEDRAKKWVGQLKEEGFF